MLNSYLIFLTLLFSLLTHAVPENTLPQMQDEILNFYEQGESVTYTGVSGKDVYYHALRRGHKNAIAILPWRTEPTKKYAEVTYDLRELKADFFLWDPRGQGYSERLLEDPQKGYIESYKDYASDFKKFSGKGDPKLYMGSATNQWLIQAIKLTRKIMRDRKKLKKVPMIFFQAGLDEFSKDERQQKFCQKHSKCTLVRFENSKHEMSQERDEIRNQVIEKTKAFVAPLFQ